jgi:ligand-binding sensor domain-containing protein
VDISGNIPLGPVNVIREHPTNRNVLYVGTDVGVYVTTDGGKTWKVLGGNLPSTFVADLIVHPRDHILVIATHGRGMWAIDVAKFNPPRRRFRFR